MFGLVSVNEVVPYPTLVYPFSSSLSLFLSFLPTTPGSRYLYVVVFPCVLYVRACVHTLAVLCHATTYATRESLQLREINHEDSKHQAT